MAVVSAPVLFLALLQPWLLWQIGGLPIRGLSTSVHSEASDLVLFFHAIYFICGNALRSWHWGFEG